MAGSNDRLLGGVDAGLHNTVECKLHALVTKQGSRRGNMWLSSMCEGFCGKLYHVDLYRYAHDREKQIRVYIYIVYVNSST